MTLVLFGMAAVTKSWIRASHSSLIVINPDGSPVDAWHFFLRNAWILGHAQEMLPRYCIIALISFVYYRLYHDLRLLTPYLELIVNALVVLSILYSLVTFVPESGILGIVLGSISILVFYLNVFWLFPIWIKGSKRKACLFITLLLCIGYSLLASWCLDGGLYRYYQEAGEILLQPYASQKWLFIAGSLTVILSISSFYAYFRTKAGIGGMSLNLQLQAKEAELKLLKAQINPHFLYNTLNTLYATALEEDAPRTAESTVKLANLLRYMQEDMAKDFIPLKSEVEYLKDYISIQKIRCEVEPTVRTVFTGIERHVISPGLFIPFVENAFKYGIDPTQPSHLAISIICLESAISFTCANSFNEGYTIDYREKGFGIGIENTRRRLKLVYPENHTFEIEKSDRLFTVRISILDLGK